VGHAPAQALGRHVDQLDLIGVAHHLVGHGLALGHTRDLAHDVVQRFQVLDVDGGEHADAGAEDLLHVLPALGVTASRDVGVRQLVDQDQGGAPGQDGVDVHLLEGLGAVRNLLAGQDLETLLLVCGVGPIVGFDEADEHVAPPCRGPSPLVEHGVGLADAGGRTEIDAELAFGHQHQVWPLVGPIWPLRNRGEYTFRE
jgi:hypothetical protein